MNIRDTIRNHNLRLTKSLGQNFLKDTSIVKKIVDSAGVAADDLIIEVGPGIGSMTIELAKRAGRVAAVEIDSRLIPALISNLEGFDNVDIINRDILELDINKDLIDKYFEKELGFKIGEVKVVANLPYYITTPIIMKFLEENASVDAMVFMVQKEVADRILASPGRKEYGALSVVVQYYSDPKKLFNVSPGCFIPKPDVDSTVIMLRIKKEPVTELLDKKMFFRVVKAAFGQRRKTLLNALSNCGCFKEDKEGIKQILEQSGIDPQARGETLSIMKFSSLANSFSKKDC